MHSHANTYPHTHITHLLYSCKWYFQVELLCCSFLHCLLLEEDQKVLHLFETGGSEATSVVKEKSESGVAEHFEQAHHIKARHFLLPIQSNPVHLP